MTESQPLVSIIMPVYNCERFLSESIESVISQSYPYWELIIVDDGSRDNSISIIQSYVESDSRIKLYKNNTEEHGPGAARNYGMEQINGKYTYFIDADDWIEADLLRDTVILAEEMNADLVPFGFIIEDNGDSFKKPLKPNGNFEFEDFSIHANEMIRGTWSECHELIKSSLLKDIRHNKYKTGEDICFQMDLLCNVKKICGIDREYYHYRIVRDSISHAVVWNETFVKSNIAVWDKELKFLKHCGLTEETQIIKNTAIERYTGFIFWICEKKCPLSLSEKYQEIKTIGNMMDIKKYKLDYHCKEYSGLKKILKMFVKYNLENILILIGTLCFKMLR